MTYTQTQDGRIKVIHTEITTFIKIDGELQSGTSLVIDGPKNPQLIDMSDVSDRLSVNEIFKIGEAKYKDTNP